MPVITRAQVVLRNRSNMPEDSVVNTFNFTSSTAPNAALLESLSEAVRDFYVLDPITTTPPFRYRISDYLGGQVADTGHQVRMYTYDEDTGARLAYDGAPPEHIEAFDFLGDARGDTPDFPAQVACALTTRATTPVAVPLAQRSGRVYIGPLNLLARYAPSGAAEVRVDVDFAGALIQSGQALMTAASALGPAWCVYSRPYAGRAEILRPGRPPLPALPARSGAAYIIDQVTVDNRLDVQRRRGMKATTRYTT